MPTNPERTLSRREFAQRAAMLSATATLVPAGVIVSPVPAAASQAPGDGLKLSDAGRAEAESRYQQILSLYSSRLDDEQKANVRRMCVELQPMLDRVRGYTLENGDPPALYLKPLVERPKKQKSTAKPQSSSGTKKP